MLRCILSTNALSGADHISSGNTKRRRRRRRSWRRKGRILFSWKIVPSQWQLVFVCVCACVHACVCVCVCVLKYSGSSFISLNGKVCPLGTPTKAKLKKS